MRIRAFEFCIILILFNISIFVLNAISVFPPNYTPRYGNASSQTLHPPSFLDRAKTYIIQGFVNPDGTLNKGKIIATVGAIAGFLALLSYASRWISPNGMIITVFSLIFWGSFTASWATMREIFITMGLGILEVPFFFVFAIFFILGIMEIAGGATYE